MRTSKATKKPYEIINEKFKEELIAELWGSYMSAHFGIDNDTEQNSASYLSGWLKVLRENPQYITQSSAKAWQAFQYLTNNKE